MITLCRFYMYNHVCKFASVLKDLPGTSASDTKSSVLTKVLEPIIVTDFFGIIKLMIIFVYLIPMTLFNFLAVLCSFVYLLLECKKYRFKYQEHLLTLSEVSSRMFFQCSFSEKVSKQITHDTMRLR